MFIAILFLIVPIIFYFSFRDWLFAAYFSTKSAQKLHHLIETEISLGKWEEAQKHLKLLSRYKKEKKSIYLFEIRILCGKQLWDEAYKRAERASREFPEELLFRLEEAKILTKSGHPKIAIDAFNVCAPILRQESDLLICAEAFLKAGFSEKCLEILEPLLESTENGEIFILLAEAYFEKKDFYRSLTFFQKCIEGSFENLRVFLGLAYCYRQIGNLVKAEEIFRRLLEKDPKDLSLLLGLGMCLQDRKQYHKALLIYQTSPLWDARPLALLKEAGFCALKSRKYAFAERYFLEVIQKEPPHIETLSSYGYCLQYQAKWKEAEAVYLRMIQLFPSDSHGFRALAWLFGVGRSFHISEAQGLHFAEISLKMKNDLFSWEILSAAEARVGNFSRAYQIQQSLAQYDKDKVSRMRRQSALRTLRKQLPLEEVHVCKENVA